MQFFSAALLFGFIAFVTCADQYEQYPQKPQRRPPHKTMKQSQNYQQASDQVSKPFNADEVQNILMNAIPGKDYPTFSMDYMPKTSFKCDGPNIHYPGYYADVEAGCQVFHYCPPKLQESYQPPQGGYQQKQQYGQEEQQYNRKKRASYGQPQPATYYPQDVPEEPQYQAPPPMKPTYHQKPKYEAPAMQEQRDVYQPPPQQYEQEEQLISWLCPNQTIFNQQTLVCEWFFNVVCEHAVQNYDLANSRLYHEDAPLLDEVPVQEHPSNLNTHAAPQRQQAGNYDEGYQPKPKYHKTSMPKKSVPQQYE